MSPMRQTWISPRRRMPSGSCRETPPTIRSSSAFFTSACPKISGAREAANRSYGSFPALMACKPICRCFSRTDSETPASPS